MYGRPVKHGQTILGVAVVLVECCVLIVCCVAYAVGVNQHSPWGDESRLPDLEL